jgi:hypothetical protein
MNDIKPIAIIAAVLVLLLGAGAWWLSRPVPKVAANTTPGAVTATEAPIDKPAPPNPKTTRPRRR